MQHTTNIVNNYKKLHLLIFGLFVFASVLNVTNQVAYAVCVAPATDYGTATQTVNIPTSDSYRVWSRIKAPDATNNSYLLEVDGGACITVGDSAITANTWTWVDYQSGSTTTKTNLTLTAGTHTFKMIGREANVQLDRVIFTTDETCVPTGVGTNCSDPPDTTPPAVSLTAPANNATISGTVSLAATASDDVAVTRVEFRVDGTVVNNDTNSPYSYSWNSTSVSNGAHSITARAYDAAGNNRISTAASVTVSQAPPPPTKAGDINGDSLVSLADFSILAANWGRSGMTRSQGDLSGDGVVSLPDFSILAANWGT